MRKTTLITLVLVMLGILVGGRPVIAQEILWEINWNKDGALTEVVRLPDTAASWRPDSTWQVHQQGEKVELTRNSPNWRVYNQRQGRLPLTCQATNFVIFHNRTANWDSDFQSDDTFLQQITQTDSLKLEVALSGTILKANGTISGNKVSWENPVINKPYVMERQYNYLAIMAVSLGVALVITVFYLFRQMQRTNTLIEELEYDEEVSNE